MRRAFFITLLYVASCISVFGNGKSTVTNSVENKCKVGIYVNTLRIHESEEVFEVHLYWWARVDSVKDKLLNLDVFDLELVNSNAELIASSSNWIRDSSSYLVNGSGLYSVPFKADYHNFPFDNQKLTIAFESELLNRDYSRYIPDLISSQSNQFKKGDILILNGDSYGVDSILAYETAHVYKSNFGDSSMPDSETYSKCVFDIVVSRDPTGIMIKTIIPLLVVLTLAYLVFFIPADELDTAAALTVTALLAAMAFQWTISQSLPVVTYLTLIDKIFYLVYVFIFYSMLQTVLTYNLDKRSQRLMESEEQKALVLRKLSIQIELHSRYVYPISFLLLILYMVPFS